MYERIVLMFGGIQESLVALGNLGDTERGRLCINTVGKPCVLSKVGVGTLINNRWSDIVAQDMANGVNFG